MVNKTGRKSAKASLRSNSKPSPAALRALAEAELRRKARSKENTSSETETGGPAGLEPIRYGDWEKDGIVSDF